MRFAPLPLLVVAVVFLHRIEGLTAPPAVLDPTAAAMTGMRYVALATGWYLLVGMIIGAVAHAAHLTRAVALLDRASPALIRNGARAWAGMFIVLFTLLFTTPAGATEEDPPVLRHLPEEEHRVRAAGRDRSEGRVGAPSMTTSTTSTTSSTPPSTAVAPVAPTTTTTTTTTTTVPASPPGTVETVPPVPKRSETPRATARVADPSTATQPTGAIDGPSWTVRTGDHFWSIAERRLASAWDRAPSVAEIVPYWRRLIATNRDRLADPANVDLIFPGQVLRLPAPSAPPAPPGAASE